MYEKMFNVALGSLAALTLLSAPAFAAGKKTKVDTPVLSCGDSTQTSINIQVCAPSGTGATGDPAGFSLQWETVADFLANNGWYLSEDDRLCKGSFSGNANLSRYNLAPGECVTVDVGEFLFDNGASTNCLGELTCGTSYVFHAFNHATSKLNRSDFTGDLSCSTLACDSDVSCTLSQGYWKTHNPLVCDVDPESPLCVQWPVSSLELGAQSYTVTQLVSILYTPAQGNGLVALAHQLIAAKLNIANGADPTDAAASIAAADVLIGSMFIPPVGADFLKPSLPSALTTALTAYNEGASGPGHCQ
jgi:hypothetical protein